MAEQPVELTESPIIADGTERRLDPQFVPCQRVVGWIVTASVSAGILIAAIIVWLAGDDLPGWMKLMLGPLWLVTTAGVGWLGYAWPTLDYRRTTYKVDALGIEIRSGVVWHAVTSVPKSRVQHIDVAQGPIERAYNLGRLVIHTAGTNHSRVELPGLNHQIAFRLRNYLLPGEADDAV